MKRTTAIPSQSNSKAGPDSLPTLVNFADQATALLDEFCPASQDSIEFARQLRRIETSLDFARAKAGLLIDAADVAGDGPPLCSALRDRGQVTKTTSKHETMRTEALKLVPELSQETQPIGADYLEIVATQVRRLADHLRPELDHIWLVKLIRTNSADQFRKRLAHQIDLLDDTARLREQKPKQSKLTLSTNTRTGELHLSGRFSPHEGETVSKAISAVGKMISGFCEDSEYSFHDGTLNAAAMLEIFSSGMAPNGAGTWGNKARQPKPSIEVVVDAATYATGVLQPGGFCETSMGNPIAMETLAKFRCDSTQRKVLLDDSSVPINVGRKYRSATDAQRTAARAIYSTCAWDSCTARFDFCQMHHIHEWNDDGPTDLDNLLPLCNQHHDKVHGGKWSIKLKPDRSLEHYQPNGKLWKTSDAPNRSCGPIAESFPQGDPMPTAAQPWPMPEPMAEPPF